MHNNWNTCDNKKEFNIELEVEQNPQIFLVWDDTDLDFELIHNPSWNSWLKCSWVAQNKNLNSHYWEKKNKKEKKKQLYIFRISGCKLNVGYISEPCRSVLLQANKRTKMQVFGKMWTSPFSSVTTYYYWYVVVRAINDLLN